MNSRNLRWYAIALALLVVGLSIGGAPMSTLLIALVVLACPVMMMVMMGSHGHSGDHDKAGDKPAHVNNRHDHGPTSSRS